MNTPPGRIYLYTYAERVFSPVLLSMFVELFYWWISLKTEHLLPRLENTFFHGWICYIECIYLCIMYLYSICHVHHK